jgi:hypothetical protein
LTGANLSDDQFGADLSDVKYDKETKWPDDFDPKAAGAVLLEDEV